MKIEGLTAIVTGGASGLGAATAKMLATEGARVVILDRDPEAGEAQARVIGGRFFTADVGDEEAVAEALVQAESVFGIARILVNCAGVAPSIKTVGRDGSPHKLADFRRAIEINLVGTFNVLSQFAARLITADPLGEERGIIVNTASIAAFEGQIGQVAYTASKAAIAGMCLTMARDMGSLGIRALAIAPSLFATGLTEGIPDEFAKALTKDAAFPKRLGKPEEYAKLVTAIVENPMLNGQCLRLDAGQRFAPK